MITLHNLKVYEKAVMFAASAEKISMSWGQRHSVVDHFRRASESIVINIAEGARLLPSPLKVRTLDYAIGSSLECAGCLDIARIKDRLNSGEAFAEKTRLREITGMLVGLRKRWLENGIKQESNPYEPEHGLAESERLFHHESLDVYQAGLDFMRWIISLPGGQDLTERLYRQLDQAATSVLLNVAQGNGRYSELDHRRFLDIAAGSAVKAWVYLDLCGQKALPHTIEISPGKELLARITAMLTKF